VGLGYRYQGLILIGKKGGKRGESREGKPSWKGVRRGEKGSLFMFAQRRKKKEKKKKKMKTPLTQKKKKKEIDKKG